MDRPEWLSECMAEYGMEGCAAHIAVMVEPYLTRILEGKKTIESRFSRKKIAPHGKVHKGDVVFLKKSGGPIVGCFRVSEVLFFEIDGPAVLASIREQYEESLCVEDAFWDAKRESSYATLLPITDLRTFHHPIPVHMKNRQSWLIYPHE